MYPFGFNLTLENLYNIKDIQKLDTKFLFYVKAIDEGLYEYLITQREKYPKFSDSYGNEDKELIECAKILETFIAEIFNLKEKLGESYKTFLNNSKIFEFKKLFVNKKVKLVDISQYNFCDVKEDLFYILNIEEFNENTYMENVSAWLTNEEKYKKEIELASIFGAFLFFDRGLYEENGNPPIFFKAQKRDFSSLIPINRIANEVFKDDKTPSLTRDNFNLYLNTNCKQALHNSNYCVKCHKRGKDYCRIGEVSKEEGSFYNKNPHQKELSGCPISMNISQMHELNEMGSIIAALSVATINNPLLASTGANICNDCSISCIFQKQEAVDTPCTETNILKQVLNLPYGFEIYSLLSRWNPLRFYRPTPKENKNKNILVVGLGPAGYSLAYNMAQEGYGVVAVDALKLEPLNVAFEPIINYQEIVENLDRRIIQGFGGVAEYGITSRFDKNYLKVLRIILQRNSLIKMYGGIRFGSQLDFQSAKNLEFSHIALCTGAGKPNITNLENSMIKGIKTSSEFLMALNLGAYKKDNLFNMQIRLPLVVLGGGLTALDCATEAIIYYKRMVEKTIQKYNFLDKNELEKTLNKEDKEILQEYLAHYELFQKNADTIAMVKSLGGVKIIYHKKFEESRAYKNNAEETHKTLKQGVSFVEDASLVKINKNEYDSLSSLDFMVNGDNVNIPAKTLILALGTNPNNILQEEYKNIFGESGRALKTLNTGNTRFKQQNLSVILQNISTEKGNIAISILGDTHKAFNGSVVKAMASSFIGQYEIIKSLNENSITCGFQDLVENFESEVLSQIESVNCLSNNIYEINIKSKLMAEKFQAGQFFKIQNFETDVNIAKGIKLQAEPVMLTGMSADMKNSIIKCIVLKTGVSTDIISKLSAGDNILFMGPLGDTTKIPFNKKVMVIGGGVANATSISIANQAKLNGCEVIYVGGYKSVENIFYLDLIKKVASSVFLSVENLTENYEKDGISYIKGNVLQSLDLAVQKDITDIFVAGSSGMMNAVKSYFKNNLRKNIEVMASINAPMNCGLGGVCASCLQQKSDGSFIYACSNQEVNVSEINFSHLQNRLSQNTLSEKISYLYYKDIINI
jgi:NAD(P)H-flavin reductase/NADPH-dependent glutamate synthase beta subunit-like oxidoreductase